MKIWDPRRALIKQVGPLGGERKGAEAVISDRKAWPREVRAPGPHAQRENRGRGLKVILGGSLTD